MDLWTEQIAIALAAYYHVIRKDVYFAPTERDAFRLLNWKVWTLRYHVSLPFILNTLLPVFQRFRKKQSFARKKTLGVTVAALTGPRAQQILEQAVLREFPNGENELMERSNLQMRMLGFPTANTASHQNGELQYLRDYAAESQKRRRAWADAQRLYRRRPWRGNPWR